MSARSTKPSRENQTSAHDPDPIPPRHRQYLDMRTPSSHQYYQPESPNQLPWRANDPRPLSRQNSWEEEQAPVATLPDPRSLAALSLNEIWTGEILEATQTVYWDDFCANLKDAFYRTRPQDYHRMSRALRTKDERGLADLALIIHQASLLFAGYPDLANSLNHCIPPGYTLEAADSYVTVTTPTAKWRQYPDGRRIDYAVIPSSSR